MVEEALQLDVALVEPERRDLLARAPSQLEVGAALEGHRPAALQALRAELDKRGWAVKNGAGAGTTFVLNVAKDQQTLVITITPTMPTTIPDR